MGTRLTIWALLCAFFPVFVQGKTIREDAPRTYTVKKGDTLWDISALFLEQPWHWPELWRNNSYINNPHLIYPGDQLKLVKNAQGEVQIELTRAATSKKKIKFSPSGRRTSKSLSQAIDILPWSIIQPYIEKNEIMENQAYLDLPSLLGNYKGDLRFAEREWLLTEGKGEANHYLILRKQNDLIDMDGEVLGIQVRHVAQGRKITSPLKKNVLIEIEQSKFEARQGDRLTVDQPESMADLVLHGATTQQGFIIDSLEQHRLLGKYDVVVLDQGREEVTPGTVMGIYIQGPDILPSDPPAYKDSKGGKGGRYSMSL